MDTYGIKKAIRKLNNSTFNLFYGNCGSLAIGLSKALGPENCELVWVEDKYIYGIYHCILYHKPSKTYLDGRGSLRNGELDLIRGSEPFIRPILYRRAVSKKTIAYVLSHTDWKIPPERFERFFVKNLV